MASLNLSASRDRTIILICPSLATGSFPASCSGVATMSYLSESVHFGPPSSSSSVSSYAHFTRTLRLALSAVNLPPADLLITERSPGALGLIDAASKAGEGGEVCPHRNAAEIRV